MMMTMSLECGRPFFLLAKAAGAVATEEPVLLVTATASTREHNKTANATLWQSVTGNFEAPA